MEEEAMRKSRHDMARASAAARLFRPKVLRVVLGWLARLGIPERDRDDVAAEVWLCAWRSLPTFDPARSRPERWLNRIAVHVCAHYHGRASHRREVLLDNLPGVPDPRPDAPSLLDAEEIRIGVLEALRGLSMPERGVLLAHYINGVPMNDVAVSRGMPLSTCYKWRTRALVALRTEIARRKSHDVTGHHGATPRAAALPDGAQTARARTSRRMATSSARSPSTWSSSATAPATWSSSSVRSARRGTGTGRGRRGGRPPGRAQARRR
jgi:RNA polymerase sigma-70 factor, ECF subfamily